MQEPLIVLGERGRLPQLALLGCTVHDDRIDAKGFILYAPLKRARTLARLQQTAGQWSVPRGALLARAPRLTDPQVSLHTGLTLPITRRGR
ncbi:hypothetical protein [Deinococcus knuensis]|uniref:Uncharacterized protein n=1 Tax=Deinococcus knuensis TaxID=1837380 RepID=A0ABQ2SA47_9DEIO|nr:hypothetical protein [Deinococcus knuensis]GGS13687.1 hypothetical protein GCM10008961_01070 [Deinococcus knuensis]